MTPRILVVDDEPNVRLHYKAALETENYDVVEASSAAIALQQLGKWQIELAILDMRMPEMDGLELLERMRARGFETPVVMITAYGDIPHAVRAMKLGAIDFLQKPLTPAELRNVVSEVLTRHLPARDRASWQELTFETHMHEAKRLINRREFKPAREHVATALEMRRDSPDAFNLAGVLFELLEDFERAKRCYARALAIKSDHEPATQNMRRIKELAHSGTSTEPIDLGRE
ncbi:MAG TPA: response regulator [Chthoniobacterales bacterium]|nr:response regulator [Chthoniobacterales bacterium]